MVESLLKPIYEETIFGSSAQSDRERNERNGQQKVNWPNKCQSLAEIGIMYGDNAWPLADQKTIFILYLRIGVEGRRILNCKNAHIMTDTLTIAEFRKFRRKCVHQTKKHHFSKAHFFITKQLRGETVKHFYGKLKEFADNCDFENKEETLIRDVLITNFIDPEI